MKNPKYHVYLTNEERSEVLKSLIDLKNEMIAQGKYPKKISYCKDCKLPFVKRRYNQLFCEKCAKLRYKKQQAEYARKRRLNSRKSDS